MNVYQLKSSVFVMLASTWLAINSCKDDEVVVPPTLSTSSVTQVSHTNAVSGGMITDDGGSQITVRGVCWNTSPGPTGANSYTQDGSGSGTFVSNLTGLTENTKYYVRAYAINSVGVGYGPEISFTTVESLPPTLAALTITNVGDKSATAEGNVTADNGSAISGKGVCWSTTPSPTLGNNKTTDGAGTGSFSSSISGLQPNTVYYLRAYATNGKGTSYSNEISIETFELADIDGNGYNTVTIGTQVWLDRNLLTTKFSNGDAIPTTTPTSLDINDQNSPKYQWAYGGNDANIATYGRLYTWYVATDNRNVCPTGWHVPSEAEQMQLTDHLGGPDAAGGKLKESGTTHWLAPNLNADNSSNFTALPGGLRYNWGEYLNIQHLGFFWSTSDRDAVTGYDLYLQSDAGIANHGSWEKNFGMSIRCLKN